MKGAEDGIAILEAGALLVILCALLLGAVGVTDYLDQIKIANSAVEKVLGDSGVKAFRLSLNASNQTQRQFNHAAIREYLERVVVDVRSDIQDRSGGGFRIDAEAQLADIDPRDGSFRGFLATEHITLSVGALAVPHELLESMSLERRFLVLASTRSGSAYNSASLVAIPSGIFGRDPGAASYLPEAVLVGLRVFFSLRGTLSGDALEAAGVPPILSACKVIQLRGAIE